MIKKSKREQREKRLLFIKNELEDNTKEVEWKNFSEDKYYNPSDFGLINSSSYFKITLGIGFIFYFIIFVYLFTLLEYQIQINIQLDEKNLSADKAEMLKRGKESIQGLNTIILVVIPMIFTYFLDAIYSLLSYKINFTENELMERDYETITLKFFSGMYICFLFLILVVYSIFADTTFISKLLKSNFILTIIISVILIVIGIIIFIIVNSIRKRRNKNSNSVMLSKEEVKKDKQDRVIIFLTVTVIVLLTVCLLLSLKLM